MNTAADGNDGYVGKDSPEQNSKEDPASDSAGKRNVVLGWVGATAWLLQLCE
jgi:hypothetical protein